MERIRVADRQRRQTDHLPPDGADGPAGGAPGVTRTPAPGQQRAGARPAAAGNQPVRRAAGISPAPYWDATARKPATWWRPPSRANCKPWLPAHRSGQNYAGPPAARGLSTWTICWPAGCGLNINLPDGGMDEMEKIRQIVQPELGWNDERWEQEAERYRQMWKEYYSPINRIYPGKNIFRTFTTKAQSF